MSNSPISIVDISRSAESVTFASTWFTSSASLPMLTGRFSQAFSSPDSTFLANEPFQLGGIAHQAAVHALADAIQNLFGGAYADVGRDQRELQFVQQIGVDLLGSLKHVFEARDQTRTGLLHAALQALQESRLLFDRAE